MYKVLIADDEKKICQLLQYLVNWQELNMEITGVVHNGIQALEAVRQNKPDIIITDIRMPECGGLDLIRQVKQLYPDIDFIIISGHRQFEYARKALQYGAEDYLLKPIKETELVRVIERIRARKQEFKISQEEKRELEQNVLDNTQKLNAVFVQDLIADKIDVSNLNRNYFQTEYKLNFTYSLLNALCLKIDVESKRLNSAELKQFMQKRVRSVIDHNFGNDKCIYCCGIASDKMFIIINYEELFFEELIHRMRHVISDIKNISDMRVPIHATIGVGISSEETERLPESVLAAGQAADNRIIQGVDQIILPRPRENQGRVKDYVTYSIQKKLLEGMENLNQNQITDVLKEVFETIERDQRYDGKLILDTCSEIIEILLQGCKIWFSSEELQQISTEYTLLVNRCYQKEMLKSCIREIVDKIFFRIKKQREEKEKRPISAAKQYIKQKYAAPISLDEVSSYVNLNAAYFSSVFKKETGQSFSEYLTMVRIRKAKELLLDAERTVLEISDLVGYSDEKYFSRIFRKTVGLSPSEYRKLYC